MILFRIMKFRYTSGEFLPLVCDDNHWLIVTMLDYSERDEEETVEAVHHELGPRPARASLT